MQYNQYSKNEKDECEYCVAEIPKSELHWSHKLKALVCRDCYDELKKEDDWRER